MAAGGTATPTATPATASPTSAASGSLPDIVVPLSKDGVARAGIQVATATAKGVTEDLRLPGTVEPNAYRQVLVTPLVGGRVVRVSAGLGDRVRRGQTIAQVYSPELADARAKYVAARAMLDAHDRELQRTQKLMEIGASSRQELERIHAEHAAQIAEVESAGSRLRLLGASPETVAKDDDANATIDVASPIDGVVTERLANVGLNVDPAAKLFTIVDLSSVWVVANVYEQDLHRIRDGVRAIVVAKAYPDRSFEGRVSYIDPQLSQETRTAKLRVDVANPQGVLRLGMFTDVSISAAGGTSIQIPKGAVQSIGEHQVVYLPAPDDPTRFTEREVRVGRSMGDSVEVVSGVNAGESVVSQGSFFIRAEAERLGLRSAVRSPSTSKPSAGGVAVPPAQTAKIVVSETGFEPAKVSLRAGRPARITFVRTTDQTCGTEVVFPSLDVKRVLPLNQPVTIEFTPQAGEIAFACGMNMLKGTVVVE
jgi:RND family efflux transporter MFP subunit